MKKNHERFNSENEAIAAFEEERLDCSVYHGEADDVMNNFKDMFKWLWEDCWDEVEFKMAHGYTTVEFKKCNNCKWCRHVIKRDKNYEQEILKCMRSIPFETHSENVCNCWDKRF